MKGIILSLLLGFAAGASALAQSPPDTPRKFATIKSIDFYDPGHPENNITALASAMAMLEREFAPTAYEIQNLTRRASAIEAEYKALQASNADGASLKAKSDEYEALRRTIDFKAEEASHAFERRRQQLAGPIQQKIGEAVLVFMATKGYTDIIDLDGADAPAMPPGTPDETAAFAAWYNAQPDN